MPRKERRCREELQYSAAAILPMERPWGSKLIIAETQRGAESSVATPRGSRSSHFAVADVGSWMTYKSKVVVVEVCSFQGSYKAIKLRAHQMEIVHIIKGKSIAPFEQRGPSCLYVEAAAHF